MGMWNAYVKGLVILFTRPAILIVLMAGTLLGLAGFSLPGGQDFLSDAISSVLAGEGPGVSLSQWPAYLWGLYPNALLGLGIALFWFILIQLVTGYWLSDYVASIVKTKKASMMESAKQTFSKIPRLFYITWGLMLALLAGIALLLFFSEFFGLAWWIAPVFFFALVVAGVFVGVKFAFVIPALVVEQGHLGEALSASYAFSNKSFFSVLGFVILLWLASQLVGVAGGALADVLAEEEYGALVILVFYVVGSAFITSSGAFYFFEKRPPA